MAPTAVPVQYVPPVVPPTTPRKEPCAMETYFKEHKDSPFGGATAAWLVCRCPRCAGRVSL